MKALEAAKQYESSRYMELLVHCPNGSHLAIYDDQKAYFDGLVAFIKDVDAGRC